MKKIFLYFSSIYNQFKKKLSSVFPNIYLILEKYKVIIKYIISGFTSFGINLGVLYFCLAYCKLWYVLAVVIAFFAGLSSSFVLQKFWSFRNKQKSFRQVWIYFLVAVFNLFLDVFLMYLLVDNLAIYFSFISSENIFIIFAQFISGIFIAFNNFLIYKFIIFRRTN